MTKSRPLLESFIVKYMPEPWANIIYDMWYISVELATYYWPVAGVTGPLDILLPPHTSCPLKLSPFFYQQGIWLYKDSSSPPNIHIEITNGMYGVVNLYLNCSNASRETSKSVTLDVSIDGSISFGDPDSTNNEIRSSISDTYETLYEEAQRFGISPF